MTGGFVDINLDFIRVTAESLIIKPLRG